MFIKSHNDLVRVVKSSTFGTFLLFLAEYWENYLEVVDVTKVYLVFRGIRATRYALWDAEICGVSVDVRAQCYPPEYPIPTGHIPPVFHNFSEGYQL